MMVEKKDFVSRMVQNMTVDRLQCTAIVDMIVRRLRGDILF